MSDEQWIPANQAQRMIKRSDRQLRRFVEQGRLRRRMNRGHPEYNLADLEQLAATLRPDDRAEAPDQSIVIPPGQALSLIQDLQRQLAEAAAREGYLRAQLDARPSLEDRQAIAEQLQAEKLAKAELQAQLAEAQRGRRGLGRLVVALFVLLILALAVLLIIVVIRSGGA